MDSLTGSATSIHAEGILFSTFRSTFKPSFLPKALRFQAPFLSKSRVSWASSVKASSSSTPPNPIPRTIGSATSGALVLAATTAALLAGKFSSPSRARAEHSAPPATDERTEATEDETKSDSSTLTQFLESNSEAVGALRTTLYKKLEEGEDSEAMEILKRLMAAQPAETEWKFLAARILNEMGEAAESRRLFEDILAVDPLSFEALFENAVLMDRCGEGNSVIERLERALELARDEQKEKAARDVRLIMAQIQFLQKNVDEALSTYEELAREDPKDYRPYFCQGVIYSLLDRNKEAREKFSKYHELSPKKFEVDAYLQSPLSRVKLFGTGDSEI
ncbi:protein SLOW GREEN 1, chloroplastic [Elaeis guineensis]|uniref:Protein SLOW GREEN 1, chloroplastic n=1 Tax=Elaeis guineensis var. tenera TaxID=51953 RepID=A0A6I9QFB6_ELAGV|nr:protein SLOW GREEN 1, chloroplastic [Elaeis guineensis]